MRLLIAVAAVLAGATPALAGLSLGDYCATKYQARTSELRDFKVLAILRPDRLETRRRHHPLTVCLGQEERDAFDCCEVDMLRWCAAVERMNAAGKSKIVGTCEEARR
jgi:hypothetical protein